MYVQSGTRSVKAIALQLFVIAIGLASMTRAGNNASPTTQPAPPDDRLEFRAARAFSRGDYANALPLLKQLVVKLKDRPAKIPVIEERIKVCEAALGPVASGEPRKPHAPPVPGQVQVMTIKELGNFEYDPDRGGNIPADVRRLSGSKVRLTGFMVPSKQAGRITSFALVPSLTSCCFGQPPQVQHTIVCVCPGGKSVDYNAEQITVEGTLTVSEKRDDGYVTRIFQLEAEKVGKASAHPA